MRIKTYAKGGYIDGGFTSGGGTMTGPLILAGNPTKDLEAAPKQYADAKLLAFDAERFTSGTLQVGRLPALSGDVVSNTGSNNILLANIGISAGVYSKVTVNAKGLVTGGGGLTESDIPNLDWSKISVGRPSTVSGYGITDALTKTGGTVTGALALSADPTATFHAATKQYIDNSVGAVSALKSGDIVTKLVSVTPTGFLRCNGAEVSKTTYAALYAVVGETFTNAGSPMPGGGIPWQQQYSFNTSFTDVVGNWTYNTTFPNPIAYGSVVVTKNKVYYLGGIGGATRANVFYADIASDGTISGWVAGPSLPSGVSHAGMVVYKNYVYLLGGFDDNSSQTSIVYRGVIDSNGNISGWSNIGSLPHPLYNPITFITMDTIHMCLGGQLMSAKINSNGTLGAWTVIQNLPFTVSAGQPVLTKNRVYLVSVGTEKTYTAPILSDGSLGTWIEGPSFPKTMYYAEVFVTRACVHVVGGNDNTQVYRASILADGTLGAWGAGNPLPVTVAYGKLFATSSKLYLVGGTGDSIYRTTCYMTAMTGGLNDYSSYYNGTILPVVGSNPANFKLPDLTTSDATGMYSYIKT